MQSPPHSLFVPSDEVYIYLMHGRSFRDCIRLLRDNFCQQPFANNVLQLTLFLAMIATMPKSLLG
jgi:hypothetical protein